MGRGKESVLPPPRFSRLLFLQFDPALGSVVNATPIFEAVKKSLPDVQVTVAASGLSLEVLRNNPFIDRLMAIPDPHKTPVAAAWRLLAGRFRQETIDIVLTDAGNMKARVGFLAVLAHARRRVGFTTAPELFDVALRRDPALGMRDEHFRLAVALGAAGPPGEPQVFFSARCADRARELLGFGAQQVPRVVLVTQTSGGQPTRWFDDRFARVADYLGETYGAALYFVGTANEAPAIDKIRAAMRRDSANLAGKTDIATLAALLCQCDLVVSLDTGIMHMARAARVPMIVIAAAWQPAHEWLPLGAAQIGIVRRNDIGCRDCRKFSCMSHECMDEIDPGLVISAIEEMWRTHPPSPAARQRRTERSLV
jgi:ADP-heptose:LPS heptosyltransferase